jgi:hypothetical protein
MDMRTIILGSLLVLAAGAPAASAAASIAHPIGATDVVLRVTRAGGFVAPQAGLATLPTFALYGDGTVIVPRERSQTALVTLASRSLDERQVQALLRRASDAGLLRRGTIDYGAMGSVGVSDMPTTTVDLRAGGRHIERQAYALGVQGQGARLTPAQARARLALTRFIASLPGRPGRTAYVPHAFAVYVAPAGASTTGTPVRWPLARNLATAGTQVSSGLGYRCTTVSGTAARTLERSLRHASAQARWTSRRRAYTLVARPLLPDEADCAALAS